MKSFLILRAYSSLRKRSLTINSVLMWVIALSLLGAVLWTRPHGSGGLAMFILLNAIVVTTAKSAVELIRPSLKSVDKFMGTFVVWAGLIALVELVLGLLNSLGLVPILTAHSVLLVIVLTIRQRLKVSEARGIDKAFVIGNVFESKLGVTIFLVVCAVLLRQVIFAAIQPPTWWDTLAHHLPVPAHWLQTGSLDENAVFGLTTYPYNSELFYFWFLLPFHGELAVNFVQLAFLCLLMASVVSIGKRLRLSDDMIVVISGLFVLSPLFLEQAIICYNEIIIVALFMATVAFWFRYHKTGHTGDVILGTIPFAVFIGSDFLSLLYAPLAFGFFLLVIIVRKTSIKNVVKRLSIFAAIVLLLGSFWYVQNYISRGNPFYPLNISFLGKTVFRGPQILSHVDMIEYDSFVDEMRSSSGMVFGLSIGLSLVFCSIAAMRTRRRVQRALFFMPALIIAAWYFILPAREMRYLMFVLPFGALAVGYLVENSKGRESAALLILLVGFLMLESAVWLPRYWYFIWAVAVLLAVIHRKQKAIVKYGYEWFNGLSCVSRIITTVLLVCASMLLMPNLCEYRDALRYAEHYKGSVGEAWEWIDKNTEGNSIAYTGTNKSYPLFRPDISNYVTYIRTGLNADQIHPRNKAYHTRWVCKMLAADIDYLFVCRMDRSTYSDVGIPYPVEKNWADVQPELFQPIFVNDYVTIYKVNKSAISASKLISWNLD